jgi:ParB family chromosome partitioning protein
MAELSTELPRGTSVVETGRQGAPRAQSGGSNALVNLYWDQLHESPLNPRRARHHWADPERLRELMASIEQHGVMQNLVVRPEPRRPLTDYEVVCGSRRLAAVALLVKEGRLAPDVTLPCRIRELGDLELLHLATVENMQRQDLTPLEEADAFARMIDLGDDGETIAAVTGLSLRTVNQRLALHHRLAPAARCALEDRAINLGRAQAFTVGEKAAQERLVGQVTGHPQGYRAPDIRRLLLERTVPLSRAIFKPELYKGGFVKDLFEDQSYACDVAEFR